MYSVNDKVILYEIDSQMHFLYRHALLTDIAVYTLLNYKDMIEIERW